MGRRGGVGERARTGVPTRLEAGGFGMRHLRCVSVVRVSGDDVEDLSRGGDDPARYIGDDALDLGIGLDRGDVAQLRKK